MTKHLRMQAMYWACSTLYLLDELKIAKKDEMIKFVLQCQQKNGGFSADIDHDANLINTLAALHILVLFDSLDKVDINKVVGFLKTCQNKDGSVQNDEWGEVDTRFSYVLILCCLIINRIDIIDVDKLCAHIMKCSNFDGGFGTMPGAESHGGQIFCCVAALSLANKTHLIKKETI
eukprot:UN32090